VRVEVTGHDSDRSKFKTPVLRGVVLTALCIHDRSLVTLEDVIEFYNRGRGANPTEMRSSVHLGCRRRSSEIWWPF
jgi:cytochrome c peroxidase